ncbi:MAG: 6-bladed beta-propeller, partial [Planctomycetales bacterium]|nr:6-bladed beta-propeller [Planctomycetales bacterium]
MDHCRNFFLTAIVLLVGLHACAADKPQPVRMGCGMMTFDTVPGWGLRPDGQSALGSTHGSVVVDKAGNIYTSAAKGVIVFTPDGGVVQQYLGDDYTNIHDMEIRDEDGTEFIYGARNNNAEGI